MCWSLILLSDEQIRAAQCLREGAHEPLLASVRSALNLPPDDPVTIRSNVEADGYGVAATNALKAAALLQFSASPASTRLSPRELLESIGALPAAPFV